MTNNTPETLQPIERDRIVLRDALDERIQTVKNKLRLLQESLDTKWYYESEKNAYSRCPFCLAFMEHMACNRCICPPDICAENAHKGLIAVLGKRYYDDPPATIRINKWDKTDVDEMIALFQKHIKITTEEIASLTAQRNALYIEEVRL